MAEQPIAKTVWVLGAGFSKALGGPLIGGLLAPGDQKTLEGFFPPSNEPGVAEAILKAQCFFTYGKKRGQWDDAEQFLDRVETAAQNASDPRSQSHARVVLEAMLTETVPLLTKPVFAYPTHYEFESLEALAVACRRALAADCSTFLRSADVESERWAPYRSWAKGLDGSHTIITFNYDCVPEMLERAKGSLSVVDPNTLSNAQSFLEAVRVTRRQGKAVVLKVHGSTNWRCQGGKPYVDGDDEAAVYGNARTDVMLGIPGPSKRNVCTSELRLLWNAGLEALANASKVVFVGYRFPPTDSDARTDLLGAIRENPRNKVPVFTVLGPSSPDSDRLKWLLKITKADVTTLPLFAEDFLSLVWRMPLV